MRIGRLKRKVDPMEGKPIVDQALVERYLQRAESEGPEFLHDVVNLAGAGYAGASAAARAALAIVAEHPTAYRRAEGRNRTSTPKIPLWRTVGRAYSLWCGNLSEVLRACSSWWLLMLPVGLGYNWWRIPRVVTALHAMASPSAMAANNAIGWVFDLLFYVPMAASASVAWHRFCLRSEHVGRRYLRLDATVVRYAAWNLLIVTLPTALSPILGAIQPDTAVSKVSVVAVVLRVLSIALFLVSMRGSLLLPAKAIGSRGVTIRVVWDATRRNTMRLLLGYGVCILPTAILSIVFVAYLNQPTPSRITAMMIWASVGFMGMCASLIHVGFLSLAYQYLCEQPRGLTASGQSMQIGDERFG